MLHCFIFLNKCVLEIWKISTNLNKYREIYNYKSGSDKHFLPRKKRQRKQKCKWKTSSTSNTTVENYGLVFDGEGEGPKLVVDVEERKYT